MKFAVVKDPHFRLGFDNVSSRVDKYEETINDKINQIISICGDNGVDTLILTGDIFDKKYPSSYSFTALNDNINIIRKLKNEIGNVITIPGNHDLPYSSYKNVDKSVYNLILDTVTDVSYSTYEKEGVLFWGVPYTTDDTIEEIRKIHDKMPSYKKNVLMVHEHFLPFSGVVDDLKFTSFYRYNELYEFEKIDYFVMGHLHRGFDSTYIERKDGSRQWFINPYSLFRLSRNYYSISDQHTPEIVIVDTDTSEAKHFKLRVRKFEDVFNLNLIDDKEEDLSKDFIEKLNEDISHKEVSYEHFIMSLDANVADVVDKYVSRSMSTLYERRN